MEGPVASGDRVLVVCASRERDELLLDMEKSFYATSTVADLAIYLDDDRATAADLLDPRTKVIVGPRIGPCGGLNKLVASNPGYVAYGAATDDSEFRTPGWDKWVIRAAKSLPAGIGCISPLTYGIAGGKAEGIVAGRMDFPWVTAGWLKVVGAFCIPDLIHHYYWDVALELLGEVVGICYAKEDEFVMFHHGVFSGQIGGDEDFPTGVGVMAYWAHADARTMCIWAAYDRRRLLKRLIESRAEILAMDIAAASP